MPRKPVPDRYSRAPGEHMFTDPHREAEWTRQLLAQGYGREHAKRTAREWTRNVEPNREGPKSDAESTVVAKRLDATMGEVAVSYAPTPSINPQDPRTLAAGYDQITQRMIVHWGDGGTPYYYYNITPQEWDSFQDASSPGKWINEIGNSHEYGPIA